VGLVEVEKAEPGLADAAADRVGQRGVEDPAVEVEMGALGHAGLVELGAHGDFIDADAHGGDLEGAVQGRVIEQDVAIELPVVIVGGAAVVRLAVGQPIADLEDENGLVAPADGILARFRRQVRIEVEELLRCDEGDIVRQLALKRRVIADQVVLDPAQAGEDLAHDGFERVAVAVFAADDLLPVPLADVDRKQVVELFIAPDGLHGG